MRAVDTFVSGLARRKKPIAKICQIIYYTIMIHAFIEHSFFKNLCAWIFFVKRSTTMKGETTMEFNTLSKIAIFPWHFFWPIFWPLYSSFSTPIWFSGPEQILEVGCPACNASAGPLTDSSMNSSHYKKFQRHQFMV